MIPSSLQEHQNQANHSPYRPSELVFQLRMEIIGEVRNPSSHLSVIKLLSSVPLKSQKINHFSWRFVIKPKLSKFMVRKKEDLNSV